MPPNGRSSQVLIPDSADLEKNLKAVIAPLQAQLDHLAASEAELEDALKSVRRQKRRLKIVLRSVSAPQDKPKLAVAKNGRPQHTFTPEDRQRLVNFLRANPGRQTSLDIRRGCKLSPSQTAQLLARLIAEDVVRPAGRSDAPRKDGSRSSAETYSLYPEHQRG